MQIAKYALGNMTNEYYSFDKQCPGHNRICINGTITGSGNCVGYCKYAAHPGFLTRKQRQEHNCLGKGCFYYVAKPRREKLAISKQTCIADEIFQKASAITAQMEGMRVLSAKMEGDRDCSVRYVTISDCYPITKLENTLTQMSGIVVKMRKIDCDYERSAAIIFA